MTAVVIDITAYRARLDRLGLRPVPRLSPLGPLWCGVGLMWALAWWWPVSFRQEIGHE
jgi:hypothetical protein